MIVYSNKQLEEIAKEINVKFIRLRNGRYEASNDSYNWWDDSRLNDKPPLTRTQLLENYATSDLTEKAYNATERFEIEALKVEAERLGLEIDFEVIWEEVKQKAIQFERDNLYFKTFGI